MSSAPANVVAPSSALAKVAHVSPCFIQAPGEQAPSGHLYIINRGLALYGARVLTAGKVWGDDVILLSHKLRRRFCARAMNYLETYTIDRETLFALADNHPQSRRVIRRCALIMALRRRMAIESARMQRHSSPTRKRASLDATRSFETSTRLLETSCAPMGESAPSAAAFEPLRPLANETSAMSFADGATDSEYGDSWVSSHVDDPPISPALAVLIELKEEQRARMLQVEATLAALTGALGNVQAQQQASAERTESGMTALAAAINEIQNMQQHWVRQTGAPSGAMTPISPHVEGEESCNPVRQRRSKHKAAHTTTSPSEKSAQFEPSPPRASS